MSGSTHPNKALWEQGDFTRIARTMRASGAALVDSLGVGPGMRVLDLGCGDGTTAIPAAERGASVVGVDIADNLVAAGRARADALGLRNCRFESGDAADLSAHPDGSYDLVLSCFGAMFAAHPERVAAEMVRVTRPGGRVVMGNWIPGDPTVVAQLLRISSAYTPPPPAGAVSPMSWGVEPEVVARFAAAGVPATAVRCTPELFTFVYDGPPAAFVDEFRRWYGPTMNAYRAAESAGRAGELHAELEQLFSQHNASTDADRTVFHARFLLVEVDVRS